MIETLAERVNGDALLVHRGRFIATTFMVGVGDTNWLIRIDDGRVVEMRRGPFVMPRWSFALRAPAEAWGQFWLKLPPPGFHDLFALIKQRLLVAEGDLHPFMANLFYFKAVLAKPRGDI